MAYTKLFNSIITSTIWNEDDKTRIVWITMLAIADKNGEVQGSVPGLARIAGVDTESCRAAICKFLSPDLDSRTKDDEGRRIEEIDGGWSLLNHGKYRAMASDADRAEKAAIRQKRKRDRDKGADVTPESRTGHASVTPESHQKSQAKAEAEAKAEAKAEREEKNSSADADESDFFSQDEITPKKETVSSEGTTFAHWFRDTLPEKTNMPDRWEKSFAQTYDDLVRLDGRNPDEIRRVCQWARTDSFWASNFQSPAKLRKRNKDGIQYYDVFLEKAYQTKRAVQKGMVENIPIKML